MKPTDVQEQDGTFAIEGSWIGDLLDQSPLGVLQVDLFGTVVYLNDKGLKIWGLDTWKGKTIRDLFSDEKTYREIQARIAKRKRGVSEEYDVEITRISDKKRIPIKLAGWPVTVPGKGVSGAISIVRNMETEKVVQGFNWYISEAKETSELLTGVADETRKMLPADLFVVATYSQDMKASRVLFESPAGVLPSSRRWYRLSQSMLEWTRRTERAKVRLQAFHQQYKEPSVLGLINSGMVEMMRCPVRSEGRLVGSVTLFTKQANGFSEVDYETFSRLPMAKAVLSALHLESQGTLKFRLDMLKQISQSKNDSELYQCVVDNIAKRYGWSYISVLLLDYPQRSLVLKSQVGQEPRLAPKEFVKKIDDAMWERVCGGMKAPESISDEKLARLLNDGRQKEVRSYVSMGIWARDSVYALLNIEDERDDAILDDEKEVLRSILDELGNVIDRLRRDNLLRAAFRSAPTPVLVVDKKSVIYQTNPASERLLGMVEAELVGRSVIDFIAEPHKKTIEELVNGSRNVELALSALDATESRTTLPVNVLSSTIENVDDRRLIAIRDLQLEKKADELQQLAEVYLTLAGEMKTPLSMIGMMLEDLKGASDSSFHEWARSLLAGRTQGKGAVEELVEEARAQLRKVELTYDQLLLRNVKATKAMFSPVATDLNRFVDDLIGEFPRLEQERISLESLQERVVVRADSAQMAFVIETVLGYVLRYSPPRQQVRIAITAKENNAWLDLSAPHVTVNKAEYTSQGDLLQSKVNLDIALGKPALLDVIRMHKGRLQGPAFENGCISFRIVLPIDKDQ